MSDLRIGVVGAGHLGSIHARLLTQVAGARLVGIADASKVRRQAVAAQLGVTPFTSHKEMIGQIDAAVIAAPTPFHFEIAKDLLYAGIDLLVEKPLTDSAATAQQLVRLAASKRRTLQVGHIERFNPAWSAGMANVGQAKFVDAVRASSFPGRCLDNGVVMDLMIHDIDLVLSLTKAELIRVDASGLAIVTDHEDLAEARLTFSDGLVANLRASRISPTPSRKMQVYGSEGFVDMDFAKPSVSCLVPHPSIQNREFQLQDHTIEQFRTELFQKWLQPQPLPMEPRNALLDELHDFVVSASCGAQPTVCGAAGARAVNVAEQVLGAIEKRMWEHPSTAWESGAVGPHVLAPQSANSSTSLNRKAA
jgi:predicted dehydrogenase